MKSFIVIFLCVVFVGLGISVFLLVKHEYCYADQVVCNNKYVQAGVGDIIESECSGIQILPSNTPEKPVYVSSDANIAAVDFLTGEISCLQVGEVNITVSAKSSSDTSVSDSFTLQIHEAVYATDFSFAEPFVFLLLSDSGVTNQISLVGDTNRQFKVSYDNNAVAYYNPVTGIITPLSAGTVAVTVGMPLSSANYLYKSFSITVIDPDALEPTVLNKTMQIGDRTNFEYPMLATGMQNANIARITTGAENITLWDYDCSFITVEALAKGSVTVEIVSANSRIVFYITIQ